MTDDLVKFLRDRLDETARKAEAAKPGPWHADGGSVYASHPTDEVVGYTESAEHIAEHDPARVLAEVDAKRRIIAECVNAYDQDSRGMAWMADQVLGMLALPDRDHPDYRQEWTP
jgi:hypothetical protein